MHEKYSNLSITQANSCFINLEDNPRNITRYIRHLDTDDSEILVLVIENMEKILGLTKQTLK